MDSLYNQTNKLILQTQQSFHVLEGSPKNAIEIETDIQENIFSINKNCEKLDLFIHKLPLDQRQNAKMRCDQLKYDSKHLHAALEALKQKRVRKEAAANERELLLNRRFTPNPDVTAVNIDYAIQHQNSLQNANKGVDEMLHTGFNSLESLRSQRMTLKGAHRRIIDMANTLGLSNHTMKLIEKRASEDKVILIMGVLITLVVIVLVIIYFT
ncbi:probable Golgi SNAP receptor complex member 2 [Anoplophora glabripennis]|nr:probable Golgi SNAP receptor complex member 2 [Anoplophora glabripennis]